MSFTKRLHILTAISFCTLFTACSLEEKDLYKPVPEAIYSNPAGISNGVTGVYSKLRSLYGSQKGFTANMMGTDIFQHGKDGGYKFMDDYSAALNPSNDYLNDIWNDCYAGINAANTVLDKIDAVAMDDKLKNQFKAETRFLRAHYYYWLTLQFGDVVYTAHETKGVVTDAGRTAKETIWKNMLEDTQFAVDVLNWTAAEYGRVTKGAALQQLAKIKLLLKDNDGAATAAIKIIKEGPYQLVKTYGNLFEYNNQRNTEIVFAVQYLNNALFNDDGNQGHAFFTPAYDQFAGLKRDLEQGGRPYTRFRPTDFFRNLFDPNDARFEVTFRYSWTYNNSATLPAGKKIGDTVVWQIAPGINSLMAPNNDNMHWAIRKHDDPTRASVQDLKGFRDFFVYRLADTYLLAAEALTLAGKPNEALPYFNAVRTRAAKPGKQLPEVTPGQLNIDQILDERARELGSEDMRWMDLARTGKLIERVKKYNPNAVSIKDYHVLRPIPQAQIDLSTITFPQNKGYF
ncbi:RagB/SusD family nutrient uptake outer membrane protein [Chitinophaga nivalis]|uniref:RagB/SusD family nutrient uptake outer membrane protein n=1 Tax=Chitinophaga nivalis TaxID=2991709 RepID=A0ABT3II90_9BACT|nr:RagB/SusD family nutrient uptake outer membrane protein [Chitinophaga nivalis]MCW3466621.1 RagB/SusD family nutrient uptake outer membrane protein [Chitinophaga nivalis]MCW3483688.1 RagB/SusD family nutrient uptake outer membrane protein [Chitinophaga nivalis]